MSDAVSDIRQLPAIVHSVLCGDANERACELQLPHAGTLHADSNLPLATVFASRDKTRQRAKIVGFSCCDTPPVDVNLAYGLFLSSVRGAGVDRSGVWSCRCRLYRKK